MFKVSPDPDMVCQIRDLVGLYLNPPVAAAVFAVDEKPQIQALNRSAPMLPTTPARATHDYVRTGTLDLFAARSPPSSTSNVVLDNLSTHKTPQVQQWQLRPPWCRKSLPDRRSTRFIQDP